MQYIQVYIAIVAINNQIEVNSINAIIKTPIVQGIINPRLIQKMFFQKSTTFKLHFF